MDGLHDIGVFAIGTLFGFAITFLTLRLYKPRQLPPAAHDEPTDRDFDRVNTTRKRTRRTMRD